MFFYCYFATSEKRTKPYVDVYAIDGHDKKTPGKRTFKFPDGSFMIENDHNEPVADEAMRLFSLDKRFRVINIMPEDTYKSISKRAAIANKDYKARGSRYNRSICLAAHANVFGTSWNKVTGSEALYNKGSKVSKRLAEIISRKISEALDMPPRGEKEINNIGLLRLTYMPCVLTEAAFMSNMDDARKLMSPVYRKKEAKAIYDGVCEGVGLVPLKEEHHVKNYVLKLDPSQSEDLIISTKKALTSEEIIDLINGKKIAKSYSISEYQDDLN